ncbi:phosphate starvation-inducible protein PsiF [Pandoraea thiooxydans]|uniref:Phosphate starvation-inducible protein PsiF n=1 Tax=Pandoraea thiooxydans TaxID=445709 RepID=A0A0G3EWR9_9BURK|nr:PsiF family protein [Pandoraea thiooxydans]AKJ69211.1 phosphate starvation-inducible protein PsiF [Pandoraea thiooxydans]APR96809.1 phosphate starvation-inducible protein PsiF [Pandoraea thiooxydans]
MKKVLAMLLLLAPLYYSAPTFAQNSQQSKMTECNRQAGSKKGDERKAFMKECLSAKKPMSQQEKMKACNKEATGKKGDERKAFMKECLSGKH